MASGISCLLFAILIAQGAAQSPGEPRAPSPMVLIGASVGWAAIWVQLVVIPFFKKGESLYQDYMASGKINVALAAIDTGELIPAISRMFIRAMEAQKDKRKRPENEIEQLLQSVEFRPDLESAQLAVGAMEGIERNYSRLKVSASRLWRWGLGHVILTPLLPLIYVYLLPLDGKCQWLLFGAAVVWAITLLLSFSGLFRFHSQMGQFNSSLEETEAIGDGQ